VLVASERPHLKKAKCRIEDCRLQDAAIFDPAYLTSRRGSKRRDVPFRGRARARSRGERCSGLLGTLPPRRVVRSRNATGGAEAGLLMPNRCPPSERRFRSIATHSISPQR
jgi:hypothetical protein